MQLTATNQKCLAHDDKTCGKISFSSAEIAWAIIWYTIYSLLITNEWTLPSAGQQKIFKLSEIMKMERFQKLTGHCR